MNLAKREPRGSTWSARIPLVLLSISSLLLSPAPAHSDDGDGPTWIPFPFLFYSPETRTGGGGMVLFFFGREEEGGRSSSFAPIVVFTQNEQYSLTLTSTLYRGRNRISGEVSFAEFPATTWGVGPNTPEAAEEDYTPRSFLGGASYQRELGDGWILGPGVRFAWRELVKVEPDGALARGDVAGTEEGVVIGGGLTFGRDTRDVDTSPARGEYGRLDVLLYDSSIGSDHDFTDVALDLRAYRSVASGAVLALRGRAETMTARPPFDLLPALGGESLLRGYYQGRYRDRSLLAFQGELRFHVWKRLGAVFFAETGQVADALPEHGWRGFRGTGGAGIRVLLSREERFHLRADLGAGEGTSGFYIGLGEAF